MRTPRSILPTLLLALLPLLLLHTSHAEDAPQKVATIGVLAFDGVLSSEITAPMEVLGAAAKKQWFSSYRVMLISGSKSTSITTEEGLRLVADHTIHDAPELDVLIVPGSYDQESLTADETLMNFIRNTGRSVSWLASNCTGAFLLGHAGLLDGARATTWAGGEADLKAAFPKIDVQVDQNVVVDGRIITSNGGVVSYQAALTLLSKLSSPEHATEISELLQIPRLQAAQVSQPSTE